MNWNLARYGVKGVETFGEYEILIYEENNLEERYTNVQLQRHSNALANGLRNLGIGQRDIVAVVLPNGPAVPIVFSGIFKMGAVFLPVIFGLSAQEIRYILEDSRAVAIVTNRDLYPKISEAASGLSTIRTIIVEHREEKSLEGAISFEELVLQHSNKFEIQSVGPDELAVLLYTAGTTGFPKGVMLSHQNLSFNLEAGLKAWMQGRSDIELTSLPLNHIYGLVMLNECNLTGATFILHRWFDPELVLRSITKHRVTQYIGVPTMYIKLLEAYDPSRYNLDSIDFWLSSAAPMSLEILHTIEEKLGGTVVEGYGMTETSPTITRQWKNRAVKSGSVGRALEGVQVKIFDIDDNECAPMNVGEICTRGPHVMLGYLNKAVETGEVLRNGWFHTGDMGYLDDDGYLFITDRKKDLIIRGGENISPAEVEEILYKHPAVQETAVVGVNDPLYGEEVKAYVVPVTGIPVTEADLIEHCLASMPRYKAPKSIGFIEALPKSPVGKVLKRLLRELDG